MWPQRCRAIVAAIAAPYREHLAPGTGERPLGRRFVDDAKVTDHHAIIPTATSPDRAGSLSPDERKIYDLICRRLLSAWHEDHIWSVTTVITAIRNDAIVDRYHTSGTAVQQVGWKVLDLAPAKAKKAAAGAADAAEQALPPGLAQGPGAGRAGRRGAQEEDPRAQALHRSHAADRHGDRGQDAR